MPFVLLLLALAPAAPDWERWYATQLQLRSEPPKPEHAKWMATAAADCDNDDVVACAYMLTFRAYSTRELSHAAEVVLGKCNAGERLACEAGLYIANHFHVIYYQHALLSLRPHYAQDMYRAACLGFGAACDKFDSDACRKDQAHCSVGDEDLALFELRRQTVVPARATHVRALGRLCADRGVAACRTRDFAFFSKACATDPSYCFVYAYDAFLRSPAEAKEDDLFAALPAAHKDTPQRWLTDARIAACLREFATCFESKLAAKDKAFMKRLQAGANCKRAGLPADAFAAAAALDMANWPASLTVFTDAVDVAACGNKMAETVDALRRKREAFFAQRKSAQSPLSAQLPAPKSASQSAMRSFMAERDEAIAARVAPYAQ